MLVSRKYWAAAFMLSGLTLLSSSAFAQATRTWVSGVGDDANPCSRTAPCKTFQGAISKTAASGEINVLDPGGFGAVTITKSISIEAAGLIAGVLVSGTNGIIVNAGANDVVVLRGLTFEGLGTGLAGIRHIGGGALHVENCTINGFATGIDFEPNNAGTNTSRLFVNDSIVRNIGTGGGILVKPQGLNTAKATIDNVRSEKTAGDGLHAEAGTHVSVSRSVFNGHLGAGIYATLGAQLLIESSVSSDNVNGIDAHGATTQITISNVAVTDNSGTGLLPEKSGVIKSFGNNHVFGNAADGFPSGVNLNPM
ncbi:MAG: right-handed parallel beta-helix repeat-containing protein [Thermoanaerobaculia bacterium]